MSTKSGALGHCPVCGETIPAGRLLIAYETSRGQDMFAECPECREVVHPR